MTIIQYRHCPACQEEYNAGVLVCVECGGPLTAGPLEYFETGVRGRDDEDDDDLLESNDAHLVVDRELAKLPGLQADVIVRALLHEEIPCAVEIGGRRTLYLPDEPPHEAFAITSAVTLFVAAEHLEPSRDLLESVSQDADEDDPVGEQWAAATAAFEAEAEAEAAAQREADPELWAEAEDRPPDAKAPESRSFLTIAVVVIVGILLLVVFGR